MTTASPVATSTETPPTTAAVTVATEAAPTTEAPTTSTAPPTVAEAVASSSSPPASTLPATGSARGVASAGAVTLGLGIGALVGLRRRLHAPPTDDW